MQNAYQPEVVVLHKRFELSKAFKELGRVRPRVPFWYLAAHRIPTLWFLYRGLLKHAPGDNIRFRIRMYFERYRSLTSPTATRNKLEQAYKFLNFFRDASNGSEKHVRILQRYDSMIGAKRDKEGMKTMIKEQLAWQQRLHTRPIMTGAFLRPSILNVALPRLKPQPVRISMMIRKRRTAYERMGANYITLTEYLKDIQREKQFEEDLLQRAQSDSKGKARVKPVFDNPDWERIIRAHRLAIRNSIFLGAQRADSQYSPKLLAAIMEARREKIRNKTRERERERRGEVLRCTIERSRKGPPAHVLVKMSPSQRRADKIRRSVSEVGYIGMMKSRMGVKMKNPDLWRELEEGKEKVIQTDDRNEKESECEHK